MEGIGIDQDDIVGLIKYLIEIHNKWIVEAENKENEDASLREQQVAIDEFAARRGFRDRVRSEFSMAICQFLNGGPTGDGDGPLVRDLTEDMYRAFATRLSRLVAEEGHLCRVFVRFLEVTGSDMKAELARQIYVAMERLGADEKLLSVFENWGYSLGDAETLSLLQDYNMTCPRVSSLT
jgi:hypothetical protein